MLQYCRYPLPGDGAEAVTVVAPAAACVAVGTDAGTLWLLDGLEGSRGAGVRMEAHGGAVTAASWDGDGLFVGTCSEDGSAAVHGRRPAAAATEADDWEKVDDARYAQPLRCLALDPRYATRRERVFLCGGRAGALGRQCRGWFATSKKSILDDGDGAAVLALAWRGRWAAYATENGVKILHADSGTPGVFFKRPAGAAGGGAAPALFWEGDDLWLGWGDAVRCLRIAATFEDDDGPPLTVSSEIARAFTLDVVACGLCAYDREHVAVLGFAEDEESDGGSARPELQILRRTDGVVEAAEALPLIGFEARTARDYALRSTYDGVCAASSWRRADFRLLAEGGRCRDLGGEHAAKTARDLMRGIPPALYVASPGDVVVARARDVDDQIDLCLARGDDAGAVDALAIAAAFPVRLGRHRLQDLVRGHLDALLSRGAFTAAAAECPRLLGAAETLWEYWIFVFDRHGALADLAPHVPTDRPTLAASVYDMILERLLATDPPALLKTVKKWKASEDLFSLETLVARVDARAAREKSAKSPAASAVAETVAELYVMSGHADRALQCLLALDPRTVSDSRAVFALVERENLFDAVSGDARRLWALDADACADLMVKHVERFPIAAVADQLAGHAQAHYWYLRVCFSRLTDRFAFPEHRKRHGDLVKLYAELGPARDAGAAAGAYDSELLRFLKWSTFVDLREAYDACAVATPPLYDEMVDCLGRLGKTAEALSLLLDKVGSVKRCISFVEAHDPALWNTLIRHALRRPDFLSDLLDESGRHSLDVTALLAQIPEGTQIPGLRHKLLGVYRDRRADCAIARAARDAAKTDSLALARRLYRESQRGILCEPPHERDDEGNIVVRPPASFY